jgi:hypothetical protein
MGPKCQMCGSEKLRPVEGGGYRCMGCFKPVVVDPHTGRARTVPTCRRCGKAGLFLDAPGRCQPCAERVAEIEQRKNLKPPALTEFGAFTPPVGHPLYKAPRS